MKTGTTKSGFKFSVNEEVADDMEFLEELMEAQENAVFFPKVITRLLGSEQKKELYDHLRNEEGRVPIEAVTETFAEIMTLAGEDTKNS